MYYEKVIGGRGSLIFDICTVRISFKGLPSKGGWQLPKLMILTKCDP
jgi:hypothetical protein